MNQRRLAFAAALVAAAALSACGGGAGSTDTPDEGGSVRESPKALAAPSQSKWSALRTLPLVPAAMANLPDGKLLLWSAEEKFSFGANTGRTYFATYDPASNGVTERTVTETGHNMFCPGTTQLADGRLLVNGGISSAKTSIFNPATGAWSTAATMKIPRGYQANTILQDGSVLTLGGSWSGGVGNKHGETWTAAGGWRQLSGVPVTSFLSPDPSRNFGGDSHFWLLPAGNGKVFHPGPGVNMHWIDPNGNGRVIPAGVRGDDVFSVSGTTVMYDTGKVLKVGGGPGYDSVNANANSYVIDLNAGVGVRKLPPMAYRRAFHNSVVLPNGQVLIVGGQTYAVGFSDNNSVLVPELFDPTTESFTPLPAIAAPRNYHSVAILLPDARVVSAGGGLCGAGCAANHPNLQVWTPHYLLNADGSAATRPLIASAPASVGYGQKATVTTDSAVASFAMVRLSATTHTVNNDQRRLALTFRSTGVNSYEIDMPSNPGWALPGDWMLFAMNAAGTPSVAKIVRISLAGAAGIAPIDDPSAVTGTAVSLQPVVTVPGGTTASYSATGLPPGVVVDAVNGRMTGTPALAGRYPVTLRVAAGGVTVSTEFVWAVDSAAALVNGLKGEYFAGQSFSGTPVRVASETVDFNWGANAPAAGVPMDNFAVRWTGWLQPAATGNHVLQTLSDDGVRVWVNNLLVIDNWTAHSATLNTSAALALVAGSRVPIRIEYYEGGGSAVMSLRWTAPGQTSFTPVPLANLRSNSLMPNQAPTLGTPTPPPTYLGQALTLPVPGFDPDGDPLGYSASGLPSGLSIDTSSGQVSGTPNNAGTFDVTIAVTDGRGGNAVVRFDWVVQSPAPVLLPVQTAPASSGSSINYTAQVETPGSFEFQWTFGDGSAATAWSPSPASSHAYSAPGVYLVSVTARTADGRSAVHSFWQAVHGALGQAGRSSSPIVLEPRAGGAPRLWVVNPDHGSVGVIDTVTRARIAEIAVGERPRTLALAPDGRIWVVNQGSASLSIVSPDTLTVVQTVALPRASQPFGVVIAIDGHAFVTLEAGAGLVRVAPSGALGPTVPLGPNLRHLALNAAGTQLLVARFVTPPLPGESTAVVQTSVGGAARGGEVLLLDAASLSLQRTVVLQHSEREDTTAQGRGVPNYLGAPVIAPDGLSAWLPSKQDNVKRGLLRDGRPLDFQNTVRAISSRLDLVVQAEDLAARVDHDNSGLASAAAWHPSGAYLFVALEASRHIAVIDPVGRRELFRVDAGRAPQGLVVSADGQTLYVQHFMDRDLGVYDLGRLVAYGESVLPRLATVPTAAGEPLSATVLKGKQLFYDARDPRLARDGYMSCASCHHDGLQDGRVWDLSSMGEGLRNTASLRGRAGGHGRLHWSGNFDEVQDFEAQIRGLAGGTGLLSDAQFNSGTRSHPLGDAKAGLSTDLDALAAYLGSLETADPSPARPASGALSTEAETGRALFAGRCSSCHAGSEFSDSSKRVLHDIGTLKALSGQRLNGPLGGIDVPTLRDAWATAPYLHDGSAPTLEAAVLAHTRINLSPAELAAVVAYTRQIGSEETAAPSGTPNLVLRALATLADWVGAWFDVRVDGNTVARGQLDATGYVDLFVDTGSFAAGAGIDIAFVNDAFIDGQDRNFAVQSITLNGTTTVAATSVGVLIDSGAGSGAFDGQDTFEAATTGGWLPWDAAIRFKAPASLGGAGDTVTVRAATSRAAGVGATIELRIDTVLVGSRTLDSTTPVDLVFQTAPVPAGAKVDVVFVNDAFIGGEDRNLYVESVTVRGSVLVSTGPGVTIDQGSGSAAWDGLDVVPGNAVGGWVPWNAAMRFSAPGTPGASDSIIVRAAATLAAGIGAQMQVYHQGTLIGSALVGNSTAQDYSFASVPVAAGDRIDVVFANDAFINGEDRNLVVFSVSARGVSLLPGDATAVLDPGVGAAAFDGLDTLPGGIYGGWIPWDAALRLTAR